MAKKKEEKNTANKPPRKGRPLVTSPDGWVEPGMDTRFRWETYATMDVGEQRDAPDGATWDGVRAGIRQIVKRKGDGLRILVKEVKDSAGQPTGRILVKRVA